MTCAWHEYPNSVVLTKESERLLLRVGDFILYDGRELPVRIESFTGRDKEGPMGMTYLPWRGDRWARPLCSMRGDPRHIICIPVGLPHFGQHIQWQSVKITSNPEKIEYKEEDTK